MLPVRSSEALQSPREYNAKQILKLLLFVKNRIELLCN